MSYFFPLTMDTISERFQENAQGHITKTLTMGGILLSCMHYLIGLATDRWGITVALWPGPIFLALSLIILVKNEYSSIVPNLKRRG